MDLTVKEHGFDACFYEGKRHHDKVIIYIGCCGMTGGELIAGGTFLLGAGYSVLFLQTGGGQGITEESCPVSLDDAGHAIAWIRRYFAGRTVKIGMTGFYFGAQYALLCAAKFPDIGCVAVCSAYDYVMEAIDKKSVRFRTSFFQHQGKPVPFSPWFILEEGMVRLTLKSLKDKRYGLGRFSRYLYDRNLPVPKSRILVENMRADVLFLSAENDDILPAETAAQRMCDTLKKAGYPYRARMKIYENGSHVLGCPLEFDSRRGKQMKKKLPAVMKNPKAAKEAADDSMIQIIRFFQTW